MKLDAITVSILWARLRFIADEADLTLLKTAYSTIVRDAHDFTSALFDSKGRLVVQATHTTPGLLGGMVRAVQQFVREKAGAVQDGDTWITNDPWIVAGHTPDILMVTPIYRGGLPIAYSCSVVHHMDIGGRIGCQARTVFEEGLRLPFLRLYIANHVNQDILEIILNNVRVPDKIRGDLRAQFVANRKLARRVTELLDTHRLDNLDGIADEIISRTELGMRMAIGSLPDGLYKNEVPVERPDSDESLLLCVSIEVSGDGMRVDYTGSSPQIPFGINCTHNFTSAYTVFAMKCILDPFTPNNHGSVAPIEIVAESGSVLNAEFPSPVMGRTSVGHFVPDLIFGALANAAPTRVVAENGSAPTWWQTMEGTDYDGRHFTFDPLFNGGQGARFDRDGISCYAFPTNVANNPVELIETEYPIICIRKELIPDSGGPGKYRGGLGQEIVLKVPDGENALSGPIVLATIAGRHLFAAGGLQGGKPGSRGEIVIDGKPVGWGNESVLHAGTEVRFMLPGGGGYGSPLERPQDLIEADFLDGIVTADSATAIYGVTVGTDGRVSRSNSGPEQDVILSEVGRVV